MRTRIVESLGTLLVTTLLVVGASCRFPSAEAPSCDDDLELCPHSSTAATSVTCDCRCTIGASEDTGSTYEGGYAVCLPPELNQSTASDVQRAALQDLDQREFDQRVFRYCSRDVARFVRTTIKLHSLLRLAACVQPVMCECTTKGTQRDSSVCRKPCTERACDDRNCPTVLRKGAQIDMSACTCTRASVCGVVAPQEEKPGLCRDWITSTKRPPASASVAP